MITLYGMIKAEINDTELNNHLSNINKDDMTVFVMADGRIRGALFHGTRFVNQMRAQHKLGILETMVLGQASLCSALMIPMMKGREHVCWKYEVDGPVEGFNVEADSTGYVRGYMFQDHIPVDKPLENWDLAPFLGTGNSTVTTFHPGDKAPMVSSVEAVTKNIAKDLAWYYSQSEQISTAFNTSIQLDKQGRVVGAGAMYLQVMPETGGKAKSGSNVTSSSDKMSNEELLENVELAFRAAPSLGQWFSEGGNLEDMICGLFREFKPTIALHRDIIYDCPCSKESYIEKIKAFPKAQIDEIKNTDTGFVEICCRNCASVYKIPVAEI